MAAAGEAPACNCCALPARETLACPTTKTSPLIAAFIAHRAAQALGINDDSLGFVLLTVIFAIGFAFSQWQSYQDDDDDFFDTYDSRRGDRELSNRNRV